MNYVLDLSVYIRFFSGFLAICLAYIIWRKKLSNGAVYLALFEFSAAIWSIFNGMGSAATTVALKLLWAQFAYIGITSSGVFFLLFALVYTKRHHYVNTKNIVLLFVLPFVTLLLAFTNPYHNLIWKEINIVQPGHQSVIYYGAWFWIFAFYEYLTLTGGIILLLIYAFKVYRFYRINVWLLLLGTPLPFISNIVYVFKLVPVVKVDFTPITFIFTGVIVAISLFWFRMFDIMPLAYKQVIDHLQVGMLVVDSANRVVDTNPAFNQILGFRVDQKNGHRVDEILSIINLRFEDFSEKNRFTAETFIDVGGERKCFEVMAQKVFDKNHRVICKIFTLNDITSKKAILNAIAESNNKREFELIEKGLLIKDLNAYAHTVAHDLKSPINNLVGFSEVIMEKLEANDTKGIAQYVDILSNQSLKMAKIIDELLKLSTIRKEEVTMTSIDSGKMLQESIKTLANPISSSKATITYPAKWPMVMGHPQWIEEVWVNLISNGIKYGGNPPEIHIGYEEDSPTTYRFWVRDNGNGLNENSFEKIFDDFERLGRKDVEGHGFGLAIVKRIVEKLGGNVDVSSTNRSGEGCLFGFTLKKSQTV